MSVEQNKTTLRRWIEAFNKKNLDVLNHIYSTNIKYHGPGQEATGIEEYRKVLSGYFEALPDGQVTAEDMIAEGDRVVTRFSFSGTHKGELMGVAATGKSIKTTGVVIDRFEDALIVEEWEELDTLGMMQQIGAIDLP